MWLVLAAVVIVGLFGTLLSSYYDVYSNAGSQPETLTGRIGIWGFTFSPKRCNTRGSGMDSIPWHVIPLFGPDQFEARQAHNELIQQFYAYGLIGVCIFLGIYGSMYLQIRKLPAGHTKTPFLAFLIFILMRGLADIEPFDLSLRYGHSLLSAC
ncbi:hypothetical protein [Acidobacterium sp. S8]|uniref:hypothetical protein n=1 Tax=Acidobacterium sp. S8 TaxID=1641854 RepID=UPI00131E653E|nr:hypothetical protein [Acidobacterium sp. S8]